MDLLKKLKITATSKLILISVREKHCPRSESFYFYRIFCFGLIFWFGSVLWGFLDFFFVSFVNYVEFSRNVSCMQSAT